MCGCKYYWYRAPSICTQASSEMGRFYRVFRNRPDHVGFHISTLLMDIHRYFWLTLGNQFLSSTQALSIASISFKGLKNCAILKTNITERLHDMQGGKNPKRKFEPHVYLAPNLVLMSRFLFFNTRVNSTWVRFCSTIFFPASSARCSFAPLPTWQHMRVNRSVRFSAFTPLFLQIDYHSRKILLKYTMFC